jgi:nucleotide-binding universal stress UspA family protein
MKQDIFVRRILCPTDFSIFSARALRHAIALARRFDAQLHVVHVVPPLYPTSGASFYFPAPILAGPELRQGVEDEMRRFVAPADEARVPVETQIRDGQPWREIQAMAEGLPADLVVMGTHGTGGFERLLLGSVTEKVLRRLPCPVLTVCHEEGQTWEAPGLVRRILCATDLAESSPRTIAYARALALKYDAPVTLLHVVEMATDSPFAPMLGHMEHARLQTELVRLAWEKLAKAVSEGAPSHGPAVEERVSVGRASEEILKIATEQRADLIVMGTQGSGPLGRMLFGSTAQEVVRHATCPVLTVRPAQHPVAADGEAALRAAAAPRA